LPPGFEKPDYDVVAFLEAPDKDAAAGVGLSLMSAGSIDLQTLRAFAPEEMHRILENRRRPSGKHGDFLAP
jgi:uncharacterized protein with GYD domain